MQPLLCGLALPFELRSAPFIFNSVAEMVEWILLNSYNVCDLHYLDDFFTAGPCDSNLCAQNLATSRAVCDSLGLPLHPDKCIGPSSCLVVFGIELDSVAQVARLPAEKLHALQELMQAWLGLAIAGVQGIIWNLSSAIYIMLPRWSGQVEPFCVA